MIHELDGQLKELAKTMNKNIVGNFCIKGALERAGITPTHKLGERLKKMCRAEEKNNPNFIYGLGSDHSSMPMGPNAIRLGWQKIKEPAVYAITNSITGRKYIGSSARPDLRRAVHLYWLKNYFRYGVSNIFFGNIAISHDVRKYGVESFYMEILKSCTGMSKLELLKEESKFIKQYKDDIYNSVSHDGNHRKSSRFLDIEPEFAKIHKEYWDFNSEVQKLTINAAKSKKRQADKIAELFQQGQDGTITKLQARTKSNKLRATGKIRRTALAVAKKRLIVMKNQMIRESKNLKEKHKNPPRPLY